jgi:hypothetical protein
MYVDKEFLDIDLPPGPAPAPSPLGACGPHSATNNSDTLYPLSTRALRLSMHSQYIYIHCTISSYRARIDDCRKTAGH